MGNSSSCDSCDSNNEESNQTLPPGQQPATELQSQVKQSVTDSNLQGKYLGTDVTDVSQDISQIPKEFQSKPAKFGTEQSGRGSLSMFNTSSVSLSEKFSNPALLNVLSEEEKY